MSVKDAIQVYFILIFPCYQKNLQVVLNRPAPPQSLFQKLSIFLKPVSFSLCAKQFNTFLILFVTKWSCEMLFKNLVGFLITLI